MEVNNDTNASALAAAQGSTNTSDSSDKDKSASTDSTDSASDDFTAYLLKSLGRSGKDQVNEEELFSSIIDEQLDGADPEAAKYYREQVATLSTSMANPEGYVPVEDVAKAALRATVDAGKIDKEKAQMINATAFTAAQLDDNKECLYDGLGATTAAASMDEAMFKVKEVMDKISSGEITVSPRDLNIASNVGATPGSLLAPGVLTAAADKLLPLAGTPEAAALAEAAVAAPEGPDGLSTDAGIRAKQTRFTWKHIADADGKLAILLPVKLNGTIKDVSIYDSEGNLVEQGDYAKRTGDHRAVFRFNQPGPEYGNDLDVVVTQDNGNQLVYHVKDGGKRTYVGQDDYKTGDEWQASLGKDSSSEETAASTPTVASTPSTASTPIANDPGGVVATDPLSTPPSATANRASYLTQAAASQQEAFSAGEKNDATISAEA